MIIALISSVLLIIELFVTIIIKFLPILAGIIFVLFILKKFHSALCASSRFSSFLNTCPRKGTSPKIYAIAGAICAILACLCGLANYRLGTMVYDFVYYSRVGIIFFLFTIALLAVAMLFQCKELAFAATVIKIVLSLLYIIKYGLYLYFIIEIFSSVCLMVSVWSLKERCPVQFIWYYLGGGLRFALFFLLWTNMFYGVQMNPIEAIAELISMKYQWLLLMDVFVAFSFFFTGIWCRHGVWRSVDDSYRTQQEI